MTYYSSVYITLSIVYLISRIVVICPQGHIAINIPCLEILQLILTNSQSIEYRWNEWHTE